MALAPLSVLLGRTVLTELNNIGSIPAERVTWTLAQGQAAFLRLKHSAYQAQDGTGLEDLRFKFDLYYIHMADVFTSPVFAEIRMEREFSDPLDRLKARIDHFAVMIDGQDRGLRDFLPEFTRALQENERDMQALVLSGVTIGVRSSTMARQHLSLTLKRLGWVLLVLVVALGLTAVMIGRLFHRGQVLTTASNAAAARMNAVAARMQAMVTSSLDAILMVDTGGRILSFNGAAETVFGYSRDEAIGKEMVDLIVPDHLRKGHLNAMARFLATGEAQFMDRGLVQMEAKRKSGEIFPVELSITLSHSGEDTVFVSYLRDISDRIASESELTRARDDALAGERAKANLLNVMSHEMRTPLSGVLGSLELLETTGMTQEQYSYMQAMKVSGELLLHHVNEVLELSQLEAGGASEQAHGFDLVELMFGLVESQKATARSNGNTLELRCRVNEHPIVLGRPRQIQQVLLNLIGNALKFTRDGNIMVEVERKASNDQVEFLICDTGTGIAEADLDRIFEDFVTLDSSYGRTSQGTGLGLAITRRIVESLGGAIAAESELGEGSVFRVTLPLPEAIESQKKKMHKLTETQASKHLLVVEDNDINRLLMAKTLQRLGHQVTTAAGGAEAVEAASKGQFDLILMDISMPGVDGSEACRRIRAQKLAEGVNIVALTAHAADDDHARILESGFAEVATKPISRNELAQLITRRTGNKVLPDHELRNLD